MSVLDQLHDLERQLVGRLRELEPLVREYEELRAAAGRLGVKYEPRSGSRDGNQQAPSRRRRATSASTAEPARTSKRATRSGTSRSATRRRPAAPAGERQQQMFALVGEHPGITIAEIAERLGVDATGLYRAMRRLTEAGQIRKDGRRLYPTSQEPTADPTPEATSPDGAVESKAATSATKSG